MATATTGAIQAPERRERRYRFERQKAATLAEEEDSRDLKRRRDTKA
jgi:hypothetical protein